MKVKKKKVLQTADDGSGFIDPLQDLRIYVRSFDVPRVASVYPDNAGIRWWPWHIYSGWWLGARGQWMEYNRGGIFSRSTEEGEAVGAGLSAGYTRMLHRNWNIEFGLGVWGGTTRYTTYACPSCGTVTDGGKKAFILPDDLMVSLIYIF